MSNQDNSQLIDQTEKVISSIFTDPIGYFQEHQTVLVNFCLDVTYAILILVIGWLLAKVMSRITFKIMTKANIETTVSKFLSNIVKYTLLTFVITASLSKLGIQTASFVAIIGAASFAVGLALQGSLSNFAAGVILLLFRPIKVGEYVDVAGQQGTVEEITIFTTTLLTTDNKVVIIPNSNINSGIITNFSRMEKRRVDFCFGIAYGSDLKKAKEVVTKMFENDERVIKENGITVVVGKLNSSSIDLTCRVWVKSSDYWSVYFDSTENVIAALKEAKIEIPFQTMTVINSK